MRSESAPSLARSDGSGLSRALNPGAEADEPADHTRQDSQPPEGSSGESGAKGGIEAA